ncbi:Protein of unknown function [Gryllus bimaculatus]|nr:Protein of unknown function [Gryllus bimaculatus]
MARAGAPPGPAGVGGLPATSLQVTARHYQLFELLAFLSFDLPTSLGASLGPRDGSPRQEPAQTPRRQLVGGWQRTMAAGEEEGASGGRSDVMSEASGDEKEMAVRGDGDT